MFTKIINPTLDIYNLNTGQFLGTATFILPPQEEKKILNLLNYGIQPSTVIVVNADLYFSPEDFAPPSIYETLYLTGLFKADFEEEYSKKNIPIEIIATFDFQARSVIPKDQYYFVSGQFSNINIESISRLE